METGPNAMLARHVIERVHGCAVRLTDELDLLLVQDPLQCYFRNQASIHSGSGDDDGRLGIDQHLDICRRQPMAALTPP